MSIWDSNLLCVEEINELSKNYVFTIPEIECLYERFKYLDKSNSGYLTFAEFHMIPEFYSNPFSKLIMDYIEIQANYEKITFVIFIEFMSIFNERTNPEKRIKFLFDIFDLEKEKKLTKETLLKIHNTICNGNSLKEVENLLQDYDQGKKGYLDFEDFCQLYYEDFSLEKNMLFDFRKNIENVKDESIWDILWPSNKKNK